MPTSDLIISVGLTFTIVGLGLSMVGLGVMYIEHLNYIPGQNESQHVNLHNGESSISNNRIPNNYIAQYTNNNTSSRVFDTRFDI